VLAASIAGIGLVIFILALNMTVAVGTLNGILFYANIVAANADIYFLPFKTANFITVFISWLNLDIGFDVCFIADEQSGVADVYQAFIRLAFPAYVTCFVIVTIVACEYSPKFAKIIGKGNPVAVLATMILLSSAKFLNVVLPSFSLLHWKPAFGSRNVDVTVLGNIKTVIEEANNSTGFKIVSYLLFSLILIILPLYVIFSALVFSWQWLSAQYQGNNTLLKWVKYQKLHHFLEPYHAPYNGQHRYWTGLLLFVRIFLHVIALLNFSLDPRVNLVSVILIVGGLILLKGVIAKRVYKNWLIDVMETIVYFNLVAFSALTLYYLEVERSQAAAAYTSVTIIFALLLGVITFHVLRYTRLYERPLVEKSFEWISSKLEDKNPRNESLINVPEELDGYQLVRTVAGDQELPTITYSVIEISQPAQTP
jgi:transcription initiation factor TFIID subunit 2/histone acetyltransferase MYST3